MKVPYKKSHIKKKKKHPNQALLKLRGICAKPCLTVSEIAYLDYSRYLDYFPFIKHHFLSMTYKIVLKNPHQLSSSNRLRDYIAQLAALPLLEAYVREQSLLKINIEAWL